MYECINPDNEAVTKCISMFNLKLPQFLINKFTVIHRNIQKRLLLVCYIIYPVLLYFIL